VLQLHCPSKIYYFLALFSLILFLTVIYKPQNAYAQVPFGGLVVWSFFCNCSANYLIFLTQPSPGFYSYFLGTQAFLNYNLPRPGIWVLGLYTPGGVCLVWSGPTCVPFATPIGTINPMVGTSI
jgi:hypothetical protein